MTERLKKILNDKMRKGKEKGFTLVELLVVIAIIAVLATVSVVGYLGFTSRAKLSNDQQMITMMNTSYYGHSIVQGTPTYPSGALSYLYSDGFTSDKLTTTYSTGYSYAFDEEQQCFVLLDDTATVVYPEDKVSDANKQNLWCIYTQADISGISKYIAVDVIDDQDDFNDKYTTGGKLDLNGYVMTIDGSESVTLYNGSVLSSNKWYDANQSSAEGNGVDVKTIVSTTGSSETSPNLNENNIDISTDKTIATISDKAFIRDTTSGSATKTVSYLIASEDSDNNPALMDKSIASAAEEIRFEDCLFISDANDTNGFEACLTGLMDGETGKKVVFENCKFIGSGKVSLFLAGSLNANKRPTYEVRNCEFLNAKRGINISKDIGAGSIIENCIFSIGNDTKSSCVQLSNFQFRENFINYEYYNTNELNNEHTEVGNYVEVTETANVINAITFKNNQVISAKMAINIHESMVDSNDDIVYVGNGSATLPLWDNDYYQTLTDDNKLEETIASYFNFETNAFYTSDSELVGAACATYSSIKDKSEVILTNKQTYINKMISYITSQLGF